MRAERITEPAPPKPWCKRHPGGTDDPCRACGRARETSERWEADRRARIDAIPDCPQHRGYPATNCGACRADALAEGATA